jgi:hypothetical protein
MASLIRLTETMTLKFGGGIWQFGFNQNTYKLEELTYSMTKCVIDELEAHVISHGSWFIDRLHYIDLNKKLCEHLETQYHCAISHIEIKIHVYDFKYKQNEQHWTFTRGAGDFNPKHIRTLTPQELVSLHQHYGKNDKIIIYPTIEKGKTDTVESFKSIVPMAEENLINAMGEILKSKLNPLHLPMTILSAEKGPEDGLPTNKTPSEPDSPKIKYMYYNIILSKDITVRHDSVEWKVTINNEEFPLYQLSYRNIVLTIDVLDLFIKKHGALQDNDIDLNELLQQLKQSAFFILKCKATGTPDEINNTTVEKINPSQVKTKFSTADGTYVYNPDDMKWKFQYKGKYIIEEPLDKVRTKILKSTIIFLNDYTRSNPQPTQPELSGAFHLKDNIIDELQNRKKQKLETVNSKHNIAYEITIINDRYDIYQVCLPNGNLFLARNKKYDAVFFIERWLYNDYIAGENTKWRAISDNSRKVLRSLSDTVLQEEIIELESNNLISKDHLIDLLQHIAKVISNKKLAKKLC